MDKTTYYISVNTNEIMDDPTAFDYQFVIEATHDELDKLQELFEDTAEAEKSTAWPAVVPLPKANDIQNEAYDIQLKEVYRMLHALGTPETKAHIESMNVLSE